MKSRTFNNYTSKIHERWASKITGIPLNEKDGIDLLDLDRSLGMEIKFAMDYQGWTVLDWQLEYNKRLEQTYWGLGIYTLSRPIYSIQTRNLDKIDTLVKRLEFWVVPWDWMRQFPVHQTSGKTNLTTWNLGLAYPKYRKLPKAKKEVEIDETRVIISEGVDCRHLCIG